LVGLAGVAACARFIPEFRRYLAADFKERVSETAVPV
jgi:hypothetical protein